LQEKGSCIKAKGFCHLLHHDNGWVSCATLDVADVGSVQARTISKLFLRPAFFEPVSTQVFSKALANVHAAVMRRMSTIDLQTMSDILLDC
jgi:hypothetical protein